MHLSLCASHCQFNQFLESLSVYSTEISYGEYDRGDEGLGGEAWKEATKKLLLPYSTLPQLLNVLSRDELFIAYIIAVRNHELLLHTFFLLEFIFLVKVQNLKTNSSYIFSQVL